MKVLNSFTLNAVPAAAQGRALITAQFAPMSAAEAGRLLADKGLESFVGHADTANLFTTQTGIMVPFNRAFSQLAPGEEFVLGQYLGPRPPDGSTRLPEGARIQWYLSNIQY